MVELQHGEQFRNRNHGYSVDIGGRRKPKSRPRLQLCVCAHVASEEKNPRLNPESRFSVKLKRSLDVLSPVGLKCYPLGPHYSVLLRMSLCLLSTPEDLLGFIYY